MATELINGCSYSDIWVSPDNWKTVTSKKSLEMEWYVQCKYYDPRFAHIPKYKYGFQYRRKLNQYKTLEQRKAIIQIWLKEIPKLFEKQHFNPILNLEQFRNTHNSKDGFMIDLSRQNDTSIDNVCEALDGAFNRMSIAESSRKVITYALTRIKKSINELGLQNLKIVDFKRDVIKDVLVNLKTTPDQYNKHLSYLSMVLSILVEERVFKKNPARKLKRTKVVQKLKTVITIETIVGVFKQLRINNYYAFRYSIIFFHSGSRGTEMTRVKAKNVFLDRQEYITEIWKDSQPIEVVKIILPEALPYWKEAVSECESPDWYVFGTKLKPSAEPFDSADISHIWSYEVSRKIGIKGGIYQLKYRMLSLLEVYVKKGSSGFATIMAGHKKQRTTETRYLIDRLDEYNEALKGVRFGIFPQYGKWE